MRKLFAGFLSLAATLLAVNSHLANGQTRVTQAAYGPGAGMAAPMMPASPLAGGRPAIEGGAYMDVHGNPIVVPAQYYDDGGYGGYCPPAGAGYGDGMYADFGGYGEDQCGPHYFDFAAGAVYMASEERFSNVGPLASIGVGGPTVFDPQVGSDDYEAGFDITGRLDFGPLSMLEATYMGITEFGTQQSIRSLAVTNPAQDFQLFSVFSNFGLGTLIPGLDRGSQYNLSSNSEIHSTELSYRRYWVGANPRVSGTLLAGFRYLRLTDDLTLNSSGLINATQTGSVTRRWDGENDLLGGQFGGDISICMRQGLRWNTEAKAGIYNNHFKFTNVGNFAKIPAGFPGAGTPAPGSPADFTTISAGDQVAFASEAKSELVFDILPSLSIRGGYRVLYLNSLVTSGGNVNTANISSTLVNTQSDALMHGAHGGIEYIW